MNFKEIKALSIKELFITQIEEMILSGELKPGDRLPSERELADQINISKTIVHDGIRELSRIGFLDVVSRKGVYVADYTNTGNLDTLFAMIRYRGGMPDKKMINSLLDCRLYLECPALEILAKNHTEDDIAQLKKLQKDLEEALTADIKTFATALFIYRRTIVVLSGNCISPLVMNAFYTASISAWTDYCDFIEREKVCKILKETTRYIEDGYGEKAVTLFQECIRKYRAHFEETA